MPVVVLECGDFKLEQSFDSFTLSHLFPTYEFVC